MPEMTPPEPPHHGPTRGEKAAGSAFLAGLVLASSVFHELSQSNEGFIKWAFTIIAVVLAGLIPFTPPWAEVYQRLRHLRIVQWRKLLVWSLVWTVAAASSLALGGLLVPLAAETVEQARVRLLGCQNPTVLRLLAGPEDVPTARHLAASFERETANRRFGCPAVKVYVYAESPKQVLEALREGWSDGDLLAVGPRPDLWWPGTTRYPMPAKEQWVVAHTTVIATSPTVVAVPGSLLTDPRLLDQRRTFTWQGLLAKARMAGWQIVRPDPALSAAGELATVAIYASERGDPERLADSTTDLKLVDPAKARELEHELGFPGRPPGDSVELLCRQHSSRSTDASIAVVVTEQQMVRYNAGLPLGACQARTQSPGQTLYAFYPTDTLAVTYPLVRLKWTESSPAQQDWAEQFEKWLTGDSGKRAVNDAGLRAIGYQVRDPLSARNGAQPATYTRVEPAAEVFRRVAALRATAQRPARILLALDASGSMREPAGPANSRFGLAVEGVTRALGLSGPGDEVGLWVFQGSGPPRQLAPIGSDPRTMRDALATVAPSGGTPLYRSIVDGVGALAPADPNRATALVVLTDGEDSGSGINPAQLADAVRGKGIRVFIIVTGEASCATQAIVDVTQITAGRCFGVDAVSLDTKLAELFNVLWGGN